jgi:polyhydroxybutyrate depolymerase
LTAVRPRRLAALCQLLLITAAAPASMPGAGYTETLRLCSGGREREALTWRPAEDFRPERLVLMLHGAGGDPGRIRHLTARGLERTAGQGRWLVVYPRGIEGTWNDCRRSPGYPAHRAGVDDVAFLADLLEHLLQSHDLHADDVLVAGYSNGAHMALRLALERPGLLGGLALVGAQLPAATESMCPQPYPPIHFLHIAGTDDPIVPLAGGPSVGLQGEDLGLVLSAAATMHAFGAAQGGADGRWISLPERDRNTQTSASMAEWLPRGRVVRQYLLHGAGHVVPQREVSFPPAVGSSTGDIDFGLAVLEFMLRWPASVQRPGDAAATRP